MNATDDARGMKGMGSGCNPERDYNNRVGPGPGPGSDTRPKRFLELPSDDGLKRGKRSRLAGAALGLALLTSACGEREARHGEVPVQREVAVDLARMDWRPVEVHLLASLESGQIRLLSGWGDPCSVEDLAKAVGTGVRSEFETSLSSVADALLVLDAWTLPRPGTEETHKIAVFVNGTFVDDIEMLPAWARSTVRVRVPAEQLVVGSNRFELRYFNAAASSHPGEPLDTLAVRRLELWSMDGVPRRVPGGLLLPAGTALRWSVWSSPEMRFEVSNPAALANVEARVTSTDGEVRYQGPASAFALPMAVSESSEHVALELTNRGNAAVLIESPRLVHLVSGSRRVRPPNVVIYVVDTLRPDHLGTYGNDADVSPRLDAIATSSLVFENAWAQSSWTLPATASMLSGLYPWVHGAEDQPDALPRKVELLSERLDAVGYRTAAFVANYNAGPARGFDRGYDLFHLFPEAPKSRHIHVLADRIDAEIARWLEQNARAPDPFFLYVHTTDPHQPHTPNEPFASRLAPGIGGHFGSWSWFDTVKDRKMRQSAPALKKLYDAEIAQNDHAFGRLIDRLERHGILEDTVVIFTSDHGEAFWEHGWRGHGMGLLQEEVRIPLVVRLPGGSGARVPTSVQQIDLVPTILDVVGLPADPALPGVSVLAREPAGIGGALGTVATSERAIVASLDRDGRKLETIRRGPWALVRRHRAHATSERLFHYESDPREQRDLAISRPKVAALLAAELDEVLGATSPPDDVPEAKRSEAQEEALRALGYIQ